MTKPNEQSTQNRSPFFSQVVLSPGYSLSCLVAAKSLCTVQV